MKSDSNKNIKMQVSKPYQPGTLDLKVEQISSYFT